MFNKDVINFIHIPNTPIHDFQIIASTDRHELHFTLHIANDSIHSLPPFYETRKNKITFLPSFYFHSKPPKGPDLFANVSNALFGCCCCCLDPVALTL
mmetsp:Transcript_16309/g.19927  ORF Transcript_16309/g.19927 Transcript_16309/m.19927 type:complete len:98 (-) Transcript_16309:872-1165(-)